MLAHEITKATDVEIHVGDGEIESRSDVGWLNLDRLEIVLNRQFGFSTIRQRRAKSVKQQRILLTSVSDTSDHN